MHCCCLQVSLVVDDAHVECDSGPINFKPTVMFQTRIFTFSLKNTGLGNVNYKWAIQTLDGTPDMSAMYSVRAQSYLYGTICCQQLATSTLAGCICASAYLYHVQNSASTECCCPLMLGFMTKTPAAAHMSQGSINILCTKVFVCCFKQQSRFSRVPDGLPAGEP